MKTALKGNPVATVLSVGSIITIKLFTAGHITTAAVECDVLHFGADVMCTGHTVPEYADYIVVGTGLVVAATTVMFGSTGHDMFICVPDATDTVAHIIVQPLDTSLVIDCDPAGSQGVSASKNNSVAQKDELFLSVNFFYSDFFISKSTLYLGH